MARCDGNTLCLDRTANSYLLTFRIEIANAGTTAANVHIEDPLADAMRTAGVTSWRIVGSPRRITEAVRNDSFDSNGTGGGADEADDNVRTGDTFVLNINSAFTGEGSPSSGATPGANTVRLLANVPGDPHSLGGTLPARRIAVFEYTVEITTNASSGAISTAAQLVSRDGPAQTTPNIFVSVDAEHVTSQQINQPPSGSTPVRAFIPARHAPAAVGQGCPAGTTQLADNQVVNGDFNTLHTAQPGLPLPVYPGATIAGSFSSAVPYIAQGENPVVLPSYPALGVIYGGSIAIAQQSVLHGNSAGIQQHPLPSGGTNFLLYAGNSSGAEQKFWKQQVNGLTAGKRYLFSAWVSPINRPGAVPNLARSVPKVQLYAQDTPLLSAAHSVGHDTSSDQWTQVRGFFTAQGPSVSLEISNLTVNTPASNNQDYGTLALTGISLVTCQGRDSDGGGVEDDIEIARGTDPYNKDDDQPKSLNIPFNTGIPGLGDVGSNNTSSSSGGGASASGSKAGSGGGGIVEWWWSAVAASLVLIRRRRAPGRISN